MESQKLKHKIQIEIQEVKNGKNDSLKESYIRHVFKSNKKMSIEKINKYIIRYLSRLYNEFHKMDNKIIDFDFQTVNYGRFGRTDWIQLNQSLTEEEWKKEISKVDINKTLSLYEGDEKVFEEDIERDKFWLDFRIRERIGYASESIGFCFYNALIEANIINITKHKIIKSYGVYEYKYNESIDSVYNGIKMHINNLNKLSKSKNRPNEIIYIDEKGGVDFNDIPKLEKFFKCNIVINHTSYNIQYKLKYPGCGKFNKTVYLTYDDEKGHYALDKKYKPEFDFYDDKKLYLGNKKLDILIHDDEKYYDGKTYFYKKDLNTEQTALLYNSKHIINYKKLKKDYKSDDIKTIHDEYKKDCLELEKYGIKMLNSYSLQKALFQMLKLDIRYLNLKTERITDYAEYEIINYGTMGSYNYIYKFDEVYKNIYSYDVKSAYPSILNHPDFKIPLKRGEYKYVYPEIFKKYTELKKDKNGLYKIELQYGFYKCKISKNIKKDTDYKFDDFRTNNYNVYTHFDILFAKVLGYDVELLNENIYPYIKNDDDKPFNCFVYKADQLIESNLIFRNLIKKLFDIKQKCKGNRIIKILSSGIWGEFCECKTYKTKKIKKINNSFNLDMKDNEHVDYIIPNIKDEDNIIDCKYRENDNLTRTSLYRMKPFLLAFQKYIMYIECIKKIEDAGGRILKIKVDAVYTDKKIDEFENKENKSEYIDGDIIREKYFDIILFKNKTHYLTNQKDIDEYLISKKTKKTKKTKI